MTLRDEDSGVLTLHNTLTSQVVSLAEAGIPAPLAAIVDRGLQPHPIALYQSAPAMKEDLGRYAKAGITRLRFSRFAGRDWAGRF